MAPPESKYQIELETWHFRCDNPTFLGWTVVAFYGLAALACARVAVLCSKSNAKAECAGDAKSRWIWWGLAFGLFFLGVNKQLNLQTLLIVLGRHAAWAGGWYGHRRAVQLAFSLVFGTALGLLLFSLRVACRDFFRRNTRALWGMLVLGLFVALRAATINHMDQFLGINLKDEQWAWVLEIGGSVLIGLAAVQSLRSLER